MEDPSEALVTVKLVDLIPLLGGAKVTLEALRETNQKGGEGRTLMTRMMEITLQDSMENVTEQMKAVVDLNLTDMDDLVDRLQKEDGQ